MTDIKNNKFEKFVDISAKILLFSVLILYIVIVLYHNIKYFNTGRLAYIPGFIIAIGMVAFCYILSCFIKSDKEALAILTITSFIVLLIWALICPTVPVNDYEVLVDGALAIVDGSFSQLSSDPTNYFRFVNYQIGYAFYLSVIMRIFGTGLFGMKAVELIVMLLTNIVLYKTVRLYCNEKTSFFCSIMFLVYPYIFIGSGVINNQHVCMLFEALAVYIYLKNKGIKKYIVCGFLICIAQILRPSAMLVIFAIVICAVFQGIIEKDTKKIFGAAIALITYFASMEIINYMFIVSGIAPYGIKSDNLAYKLLLGIVSSNITGQQATHATRSHIYYDLAYFNFDYEAYKIAANEKLMSLFTDKDMQQAAIEWTKFKIPYFIGEIDNQYPAIGNNFSAFGIEILNYAGLVIYFISIVASFINSLKHKKIILEDCFVLPVLIFGLYFFVHLLIEVQPRYRYEQYYMLFLMGMPVLYNGIERGKNKLISLKSR